MVRKSVLRQVGAVGLFSVGLAAALSACVGRGDPLPMDPAPGASPQDLAVTECPDGYELAGERLKFTCSPHLTKTTIKWEGTVLQKSESWWNCMGECGCHFDGMPSAMCEEPQGLTYCPSKDDKITSVPFGPVHADSLEEAKAACAEYFKTGDPNKTACDPWCNDRLKDPNSIWYPKLNPYPVTCCVPVEPGCEDPGGCSSSGDPPPDPTPGDPTSSSSSGGGTPSPEPGGL